MYTCVVFICKNVLLRSDHQELFNSLEYTFLYFSNILLHIYSYTSNKVVQLIVVPVERFVLTCSFVLNMLLFLWEQRVNGGLSTKNGFKECVIVDMAMYSVK